MSARPSRRSVLAAGLGAGVAASLLTACGAPGLPGAGASATTVGAALNEGQAMNILQRVLAADAVVRSGRAPAADAVARTYAGEGLRAAQAAVQLIAAGVTPKVGANPGDLKVLAVSRGAGYPRFLLGASTPAGGQTPGLHLLVATTPTVPFRLALSAQMLPGAGIGAFPGGEQGTQVVTDGADMTVKPVDLLRAYAQGLTAARADEVPYESDVFLEQVRAAAEKTTREVAPQAVFRQSHQVMRDPVVALRDGDGDTLVLGAIERTSDYAIRAGRQLAPSPVFTAFVPGRSALVQEVRVQVLQFVAFSVPREGKARLVAATEQTVGASGF